VTPPGPDTETAKKIAARYKVEPTAP